MAGKGLIILAVGFTVIFLIVGFFWNGLSSRSVDNHTRYYKNTIAHNIAVSGANIALRNINENSSWTAGISDLQFENGLINVDVTAPDSINKTVTSTGTFMGVNKTVRVKLMKGSYAKYAWFTSSVSTGSLNKRTWYTGDTIWGGFQTNQFLNINGSPVFYGKVGTSKGVKMTEGSNPQFLGGLVTGIKVPTVNNMNFTSQRAAAITGQSSGGTCYFENVNLWLRFNSDGTVTYRTASKTAGSDSSLYSAPVTKTITEMAPNGIIYLDKGDVYMSGTLKGMVTVVSDQSSGNGGGNVYLVDDIVYSVTPVVPDGNGGYLPNDACTDVMGILATNNFVIASSVNSGAYQKNILDGDIHIDAGLFSNSGGMKVEGIGTTVNSATGSIYLNGSMTTGMEEQVAIYNNDVLQAGFNRHVVLDERFLVSPPLYFPMLATYEIISWLE